MLTTGLVQVKAFLKSASQHLEGVIPLVVLETGDTP
jgi:hypothetical protein